MKIAAKRPLRDEKGQALLTTLLFLLIGLLVLTPVLNFMGTGMRSGRVYEQNIAEIYAADSGVEDALWHIRYDLLDTLLGGDYDEYKYFTPYDYPYGLDINCKNVSVTIQNIWIPKDISTPSNSTAWQIIKDEKLIIVGYPSSSPSTYVIKIVYNWDTAAHRDALRVKTIGIWLSPGFEYNGGCTLTGYSAQDVSLYKGGQAVIWTFSSPPRLRDLPGGDLGPPMVETFTFQYTSPEEGQIPELVSSWIDTTGMESSGITFTWDDSIRLYKIESKAGDIEVDAYGAKTKFRRLKSTISSDYTVAGNKLTKATAISGSDRYARNRLYAESDSTILRQDLEEVIEQGGADPGYIPEEAIIEKVYLYWSGWIDPQYWYKSGSSYYWGNIANLRYSQRTPAQLITNSKVGQVKFDIDGSAQTITAAKYQIKSTSDSGSDSWAYSCFTEITDLVVSDNVTVREYIEEAMKSVGNGGSGEVDFTLGHADEVRGLLRTSPYQNYSFALYNENDTPTGQNTSYPLATPAHKRPDDEDEDYESRYQWSYAGWSLIIFYRSPGLTQRQLYLYDDFRYIGAGGSPDTETFSISGFLAPPVISEQDKSHLTYFVGEGDSHYYNDRIKVNDSYMSDPGGDPNPENNVFNSRSNALPTLVTDGVDVDTFVLPDGCILPYDPSAEVTLITNRGYLNIAEIYTLVYLVLSFRSDITTGGIITNYAIRIS